jgi:hypothetical protein
MDLPSKTQLAICKYMDVPAAEAQSRYVQLTPDEHFVIARASDDAASGLMEFVIVKDFICDVWAKSCERRKCDAETKEILPTVAEAATDVESVENTGIEVAKELAAE